MSEWRRTSAENLASSSRFLLALKVINCHASVMSNVMHWRINKQGNEGDSFQITLFKIKRFVCVEQPIRTRSQ